MKNELADYFRAKAGFRTEVANEKCSDGSWKQHKNEMYAYRLEQVADYVESLSDDDPILEPIEFGDIPDGELHTHTIHCSFQEGEIAAWLESWIDYANECAREESERLKEFNL